jgi:hypothetical protein
MKSITYRWHGSCMARWPTAKEASTFRVGSRQNFQLPADGIELRDGSIFFSQGWERFLRLCEEMEGEDLSVKSFLESIKGIRAKCCAVDESLLNALSLLKASQTPGSDQEGHTSTPSTRISLSSSGQQRRRDEDVSLPTCSFSSPSP